MKRMLINATQSEEVRIALVDGQHLYNLDIETPQVLKKKSNIYKAIITRIEPSLEAAFIDYGAERHGFLPFKEVSRSLYPAEVQNKEEVSIKDVLKEGQEIIVQIQKEERGNKGAAVTTQISLAGSYAVVMVNTPNVGGISRRIEGEFRSEVRDSIAAINIPPEMGLIIRTAGVGKTAEELQWGVDYLVKLWKEIKKASDENPAPFLIHKESDIVTLAVRDYLHRDIDEILIDNMEIFYKARDFIKQVMPQYANKVKPYQDERTPLFTRYQIESQIETAYQREVVLPSGGIIAIDSTEALTAIDINSSRSTKGVDIEETAFHTNMEAAHEIARQLRLRDLGGLVVVDFIDMHSNKHQRDIENAMREATNLDRARIQIGKISRFGLLEMSRQRLSPSIEESSQIICPRCQGTGVIREVESLGLSTLRLLEEEVLKENTKKIMIQLPVDVATFLLNEKRRQLIHMEDNHKPHVVIIPNEHLETPQYLISRTELNDDTTGLASYESKTISNVAIDDLLSDNKVKPVQEKPAVKNLVQNKMPTPKFNFKIFGIIWKFLTVKKQTNKARYNKSKNYRKNNQRNKNNRNKDSNYNSRGNSKQHYKNKPRNNSNRDNKNNTVKNNNTKSIQTTKVEKPVPKVEKVETPVKVDNNKTQTNTRRRRNNTKTYNRRRVPINASTMSVHSEQLEANDKKADITK